MIIYLLADTIDFEDFRGGTNHPVDKILKAVLI